MKFRYSLRTLLVVTLVVGVGIGTYLKWTENERSIAAIERANGRYVWVTDDDGWPPTKKLSEAEQYAQVRIDASWTGGAAGYGSLRGLRRLKSLVIAIEPRKGPDLCRVLPGLSDLEHLDVTAYLGAEQGRDVLAEDSVENLARCVRLQRLSIRAQLFWTIAAQKSRTPAEVAEDQATLKTWNMRLAELRTCTQLRELTLAGNLVDEHTIAALASLEQLEDLDLRGFNLSVDDLRPLRTMKNLKSLSVTLFSGSVAEPLPFPPNLTTLTIQSEPSLNLDPVALRGFSKLRTFQMLLGSVTPDFAKKLATLDLPELRRIAIPDAQTGSIHEFTRSQPGDFTGPRRHDPRNASWTDFDEPKFDEQKGGRP